MTLVNLAVAMMMMMTLLVVCAYFMLIEDKVKASCLHFPRRMQGGNDDASLMISAQRVPDTQPKPELFSIPNQYPNFFQNLQEFWVSGISENKAFSPYSSVIPFLAIRTSTRIIFISNQLDCKGQSNKASQTSAPHRLQYS